MTQFVSHSPWYIYIICLLAAFGLTTFLYFRNTANNEIPKVWLVVVQFSRFVGSFLVLLLLCDFFFKTIRREYERPLLIVVIDNSASMLRGKDSTHVDSFVKKELEELKETLGETFEISSILFGSGIKNSNEANFKDKESDFENLFQELDNRYANRNVGAAIVISDGIQNKGAIPLSMVEQAGYPFYCIGVGDTSEFRDLKISKINHNQIAYLGNAFPVDILIQAKKLQGKTAVLKLFQEDKEQASTSFTINSEHFSSTINFTLNAESIGIKVYSAHLEILKEEKNTLNNYQEFVMDIQDKRQKILLLGQTPHPDIGAIKESLLSNFAYELETRSTEEFSGMVDGFNLIIFHGAGSAQKPLIEKCLEQSIPFWVIRPSSHDIFPGMRLSGNSNRYNDSEPVVNTGFGLFTLRPELGGFLKICPAVKCVFGKHLLSNSASTLLFQKIGSVETLEPLFVFNESSGIKSACFNGDGLWKWKMRDFAEHNNHNLFNELVFATVHYLSVKNDKSQFRLRYPKIIDENENTEFEAEVYNKSYEPINTAEVKLVLRNSKKQTFNYSFSSNGKYYAVNLGQLVPDSYDFIATAKMGEDLQQKTGKFIVREMDLEKMDLVANHQLLYQIANRSSGALYTMSELTTLKNDLLAKKEIKTITYSISSLNRLLDWPLIFFIILVVFCVEWSIRKLYFNI